MSLPEKEQVLDLCGCYCGFVVEPVPGISHLGLLASLADTAEIVKKSPENGLLNRILT